MNTCFARRFSLFICLMVLAFTLHAQQTESESTSEASTAEEIVVTGTKPESLKKKERLRIERLRAQLLKDFRENEALAAKFGWNKANVIRQRERRFKWGYDAQEDRTAHQSALADAQWNETQPVSVFKAKF